MLPEFPFTLIFHLVDIIMGYPIRVIIKHGSVKVFLLKLIISIDNRLDVIFILYHMKPRKYVALEILDRLVFRLMLHIKDRRQVAVLQTHLIQKK